MPLSERRGPVRSSFWRDPMLAKATRGGSSSSAGWLIPRTAGGWTRPDGRRVGILDGAENASLAETPIRILLWGIPPKSHCAGAKMCACRPAAGSPALLACVLPPASTASSSILSPARFEVSGSYCPGRCPTVAAAGIDNCAGDAAPVTYVAGATRPLPGADLLHLREIEESAVGIASIGGAGTFDGIVLSGIVAACLA
jgi:Protein of unknown function (DUF1614)